MNSRKIRVGEKWFDMREQFAKHGVNLSNPQLSNGIAEFLESENFIPTLARRAKRKRKGVFL